MPRLSSAWMVLLVAAVAAGAEEKTAAPSGAATPAEDSITAARREFELVKSARDPALQPGANAPRVSLPELHSGAPEPYLKSTPARPDLKSKSANWLAEAMEKGREKEKGKETREGRNAEVGNEEIDPTNSRSVGGRKDSDRSAGGAARTEEAARDPKPGDPKLFNPLAPFLGEWMTPQDYALLGASLQKTAGPGEDGGAAAVGSVGGVEHPGVSPVTLAAGGMAGNSRPAAIPAPRDNPFLEALNLPASTAAATASSAAVPAANPAPAFSAPPPPPLIVPPKPKLPDFVKPPADDKYFKPLKRF